MICIIVDDEPLAREAVELLVHEDGRLKWAGSFNNAESAARYMDMYPVDLVFLDIQMHGTNGIEFARSIRGNTLVVFTTAYSEYALDGYQVDAIDYLVKPIEALRFKKAVDKAFTYHNLLASEQKQEVEDGTDDFFFVKSERKYLRVNYPEILFIEGLKDYVVIHTEARKILTKMSLKTIHELIPERLFFRVNRSYIVNLKQIDSFDNNDVFIRDTEIAIGNGYREAFFRIFASKRI